VLAVHAGALLHQAAEEGVHCESLRRIVLGGEKVSDGLRHKLRDLALELGARNVDVLAIYGFTEAKLAWPECPSPHDQPSSGYHLYPDLGIMEVIDPQTGESLPPGQPGELVFTPLGARGTVVLRYRTGDYIDGGLSYQPCPYCGRSLPRLLGNISRRSEVKQMDFDKIKGTLVDFNELEHLLDDAPHIGAWQVELRKINDDPLELDELILHVQKLNVETGELSLVAEDARHDLLAPQMDARGALYFIRRPYKFSSGRPWWRVLLDVVLIPWRLLQAIFQFFNFFSMKYTGKPLDPGTLEAGGVARKNLDVERMVLWGNVVEAHDAMRRAKPEETPDLVPRSWELVRHDVDGREIALAAGVLSYDLLPDGSVLYSNGSAVFLRASDGTVRRLLRAAYIEKVVAVPE
jgi:hypothetical protein